MTESKPHRPFEHCTAADMRVISQAWGMVADAARAAAAPPVATAEANALDLAFGITQPDHSQVTVRGNVQTFGGGGGVTAAPPARPRAAADAPPANDDRKCKDCGVVNDSDAKYCKACGKSLSAAASRANSEKPAYGPGAEPDAQAALDAAFGVKPTAIGTRIVGASQFFGVPVAQ